MQEHDEKDELWELLGKAKKPAVSMRFTADVLRAVQKEQERPRWPWGEFLRGEWLRRVLAPTAVAFAALTLCGVLWMSNSEPQLNVPEELAFEEIENLDLASVDTEADFEIIDDLDVLLASEENQVWIDDSPRF